MPIHRTRESDRRSVVGRRAFLGGAATATAVVVTRGASAAGLAPTSGNFTRGSVLESTQGTAVISVGVGVLGAQQVVAMDFPPAWEFNVGDWVGVDMESLEAFPYLFASAVNSAGELVYTIPNDDPQQDRTVVRAERQQTRGD